MKNIILSEGQMKMIKDSIAPTDADGNVPLDRFQGMSDDEFLSSFENSDEGEIMLKLMSLADEGAGVFQSMKDAIEASAYYQSSPDKMKAYLDKIDEINEKIADLWY